MRSTILRLECKCAKPRGLEVRQECTYALFADLLTDSTRVRRKKSLIDIQLPGSQKFI